MAGIMRRARQERTGALLRGGDPPRTALSARHAAGLEAQAGEAIPGLRRGCGARRSRRMAR
ncbi:MAG: hypothetical protein K2X49_16095 [Acetobacteraceae bacterium]|nr:hypothetical protein [Acetobacteraceae bacterium]